MTQDTPSTDRFSHDAGILAQALPYMQRYEGKTVVVKYGCLLYTSDAADDIDVALEIPDAGPSPERATADSQERGRIERCLATLEPDRAEAVRGAYLDGYSYDELAQRYAVPLNTMRTWLRRSLLKLRECLTA